jgi:hypothetical protein
MPANLATQTMFAELTQRCLDAEFDELYDERGNFTRKRIDSKHYWYYNRDIGGKKKSLYVGPAGDKNINERVNRFENIKSDFKQRRELVRALIAAGLPVPDAMSGEIIEAMWKGGFFRLRGVLIGTLAYQCYSGILGTRLSSASLKTADADFAQFYDISHMVGDSMPPMIDILRGVDQTFKPVAHINHPLKASRFRTKTGYLVEFLTPNRGSNDNFSKPADMPALRGASAQPLRYLDYLIHDPVRAVILYKGGIPVTVPSPERYAVHKLIVASLRKVDPAKAAKDVMQAEHLMESYLERSSFTLFEAWTEACERGPSWREALLRGRQMMTPSTLDRFIFALQTHGWSESKLTKKQPLKHLGKTKPKLLKRQRLVSAKRKKPKHK